MKNYNKILEAVNRGIHFALDDFDDNEFQGQVNSKVKYQGGTKEWLDLMKYEVVDLGLPSGTLWCKYNLDVNPKLLTNLEDWYGGYYAWGELEADKPIYDWEHYDHGYGPYNLYKYINNKEYAALYKYINNKEYAADVNNNKIDNLTELLLEDDAAYYNKKLHNFKFHIPTKEQCEELINYTNNYWVNNYDPNKTIHNQEDDKGIKGLNGRVFTSRVNGNTLFIPAAGCRTGSNINGVGSYCSLWSSSLNLGNPNSACDLNLYTDDINMSYYSRYCGFSVRPVINL